MEDHLFKIGMYLIEGKPVCPDEVSREFGISTRTVRRDLEKVKSFMDDDRPFSCQPSKIKKDQDGNYYIDPPYNNGLSNTEIFTVVKILLGSRSLAKTEMGPIVQKLIRCVYPVGARESVQKLLANENFYYVEPRHGQKLTEKIWQLGRAIQEHQVLRLTYERHSDGKLVERLLHPVGILCSEFYFYLLAHYDEQDELRQSGKIKNPLYLNTYRIDRIKKFEQDGKRTYNVPYATRFQEGEFRKRVQFMFNGELGHIKFWCAHSALEAVLDRLPTARIVKEDAKGEGCYLTAETYGEGAEMWLRSQGDKIRELEHKK